MTEAVRCARCGVRYDGRHVKCPRCRETARIAFDPSSEPATPSFTPSITARQAVGALAACALLVVALAGWASLTSGTTSAAPRATSVPSPLLAIVRANERRPAVTPAPKPPTVVAFLDSPAAGRRAYDDGDFDKALEHFRSQIESFPSDAESYSNAGQVLVRLGRTTEAMPYLLKAVDLDPNRWAYRFNLARAHGLLGQWEQAVQNYSEADRLFPGDYATLFNLGQALHRAGHESDAVGRYRQAIQQKPDDSSFYLALGVSEEKLGHAAEAAAAYRRYVAMEPAARHAESVAAKAKELETATATSKPAAAPSGM